MRKLTTLLICIALLVVCADAYHRRQIRKLKGPGYELHHGQILAVKLEKDLILASIKTGDELRFRIVTDSPIGSTSIGDGMLTDALLLARVVQSGYSEVHRHSAVTFDLRELQMPNGRRFKFAGSVYNAQDPEYFREAPIIGSFVGMEIGALGTLCGFLGGSLAPSLYGRVSSAPLNYVVRDAAAGSELLIKVHYAAFVPLSISPAHLRAKGDQK